MSKEANLAGAGYTQQALTAKIRDGRCFDQNGALHARRGELTSTPVHANFKPANPFYGQRCVHRLYLLAASSAFLPSKATSWGLISTCALVIVAESYFDTCQRQF